MEVYENASGAGADSLKIGRATAGFDITGIEEYIKDINLNLVDAAVNELRSGTANVKSAVDHVWVGDSANVYKNNFEKDVELICQSLTEARILLLNTIKYY